MPVAVAASWILLGASGCFSSTGGLAPDASPDTAEDTAPDTSEWVVPDGDDVDGEADPVADSPEFPEDTGLDPDVATDPVGPPPDAVDSLDAPDAVDLVDAADSTDFVDPEWECITVYGDPACDDGNECTGDWCDMVLHTCVHSGATMEGTGCTDDGNICTSDSCRGGICGHSAAREGEFCPDEGNACTQDICASGICSHPGAPLDGFPCTSDGEICTSDVCSSGSCAHPPVPGCCHADGACISATQVWECNASTNTCYDPPMSHFCGTCSTRTDCGDGGSSSDDWCVYYGSNEGCSKDCRTIADCPRGSECIVLSGSTACVATDPGCICTVIVGDCDTWLNFGRSCTGDWDCPGPDNYCFGTYCSFDCATVQDCPLSATAGCVVGTCRR